MVTNLRIEGMTCNGCVKHVDKALRGLRGVTAVEVSLPDRATIVHDEGLDLTEVAAAVDAAGYAVAAPPPAT